VPSPQEGDEGAQIHRKGKILRGGLRVASASAGAALSQVIGAEAGAATAQTITELGEALVGRLEEWEQRRVARTLGQVNQEVVERQGRGEVVRPEIADPDSQGAKEIFEAVVDAAARSIEERKCQVIANLYSSIAFDPDIGISDGLLYLRRVRDASWRQLVALRYLEAPERQEEREMIGVAGSEGTARIHPALGVELSEAGRSLELIGIGQPGGSVANPSNVMDGGQITTASVNRLRATGLGETISRLGRLAEVVNEAELDEIARDLKGG
jgi:hypothetical protein